MDCHYDCERHSIDELAWEDGFTAANSGESFDRQREQEPSYKAGYKDGLRARSQLLDLRTQRNVKRSRGFMLVR